MFKKHSKKNNSALRIFLLLVIIAIPTIITMINSRNRELVGATLKGETEVLVRAVQQGETYALIKAIRDGDIDTVRFIVLNDIVDVNFEDREGKTPLEVAIEEEHEEIIQLLKTAGARY